MSGCGCQSCNQGLECPGGICDVPSKKPAAVLFMADYGGNPFASTDQSYMPRPSGRVAGRPTEATQPRPAGATQQNFLAFPTLDGLLFQISQRPNLQKAINALSFRLFGQVYAVSDLVEMAVQNPTLSREFYRLVQQDIAANGYAQRAFAPYNEWIGTNANYATDPNAAQPNDGSVPMGAPAPSYATDQNNGAYTPSYLDTKYLPRSRAAGQVRQRALTSQPRAETQSVFAQAMAQAPSFNGFLGMDNGLAVAQPRPAGATATVQVDLSNLLYYAGQNYNVQKALNALSMGMFGQIFSAGDLLAMSLRNPTLRRALIQLLGQFYATNANAAQPNNGGVSMGAMPSQEQFTQYGWGSGPNDQTASVPSQEQFTQYGWGRTDDQTIRSAPNYDTKYGARANASRTAGSLQMAQQGTAALPNFASFLAPLDPFLSGRSRPLMYRPAGQVAGSAGGNVDAAQQAIEAVTQLAPSVIGLFRSISDAFNGAAPPDEQQRAFLGTQVVQGRANVLLWQSQANAAVAAAATVSDPAVRTSVAVTRAALAKVPAALVGLDKVQAAASGAPLSSAEKAGLADAAQIATEVSTGTIQLKSSLDAAAAPGPTPGPTTIINNPPAAAPSLFSSPWTWLFLAGAVGGGAYLYMNR